MADKKRRVVSSARIARARADLAVTSDRLACSPEQVLQMQKELEAVLSKYMNLDKHIYDICLRIGRRTGRGVQDVKTIQIK